MNEAQDEGKCKAEKPWTHVATSSFVAKASERNTAHGVRAGEGGWTSVSDNHRDTSRENGKVVEQKRNGRYLACTTAKRIFPQRFSSLAARASLMVSRDPCKASIKMMSFSAAAALGSPQGRNKVLGSRRGAATNSLAPRHCGTRHAIRSSR